MVTAEDRFSKSTSDYTARDIAVLEGIQAIRHRPSMYIGSISTGGLVHLLWEALDNAVDEAVAAPVPRSGWMSTRTASCACSTRAAACRSI